jgi:competence protein ComEC
MKPLLSHHQIDQPDLLVISHVDQDHSGGLNSFHGYYHPARLLTGMPQALKARFSLPHNPRSCHAYPDWRWDGVYFSFLDPGKHTGNTSSNNRSCILSVQGYHRLLIPGDIESSQESRLVKLHAGALETDILLAPHHGSNTSSSRPFIQQARPEYVVYTQARGNRWGFPRAEVVARYDAIAARQFRNDRDGAISLVSSPEGLAVTTLRKSPRRIWRRW